MSTCIFFCPRVYFKRANDVTTANFSCFHWQFMIPLNYPVSLIIFTSLSTRLMFVVMAFIRNSDDRKNYRVCDLTNASVVFNSIVFVCSFKISMPSVQWSPFEQWSTRIMRQALQVWLQVIQIYGVSKKNLPNCRSAAELTLIELNILVWASVKFPPTCFDVFTALHMCTNDEYATMHRYDNAQVRGGNGVAT